MPVELEMVLRILLAMVLGSIIGYQRSKAEKPAGMRDITLICGGAALFTVMSIYGFNVADQARVAAGIVTGIGFLGAGAIIRRHGEGAVVKGITTAATIWVAAGIGMAAGAGMYIIAPVAAFLVLLVLLIHRYSD